MKLTEGMPAGVEILDIEAGSLRPSDVLGEGQVVRKVTHCCGATTATVGIATGGFWEGEVYSGRWDNLATRRWRSCDLVRVARG